MNKSKPLKAHIALTLVIVVTSILLLGGVSLVAANIDLVYASQSFNSSFKNRNFSITCLEESLNKLKSARTTTGTFQFTTDYGTCTSVISNHSGNADYKDVVITFQVGGYNYSTTRYVDISGSQLVVKNSI